MLRITALLFVGFMVGACAKKATTTTDSESNSVIASCYDYMGGGYGCLQFDDLIPQADRADACSEPTSVKSASACTTSYNGTPSKGKCNVDYGGVAVNVYRFYLNNASQEQMVCASLTGGGGTPTYIAD